MRIIDQSLIIKRDPDLPTRAEIKKFCGWAEQALAAFLSDRGSSDEDHTDIVDLIADLLHLADKKKLNYTQIWTQAMAHFEIERFEARK